MVVLDAQLREAILSSKETRTEGLEETEHTLRVCAYDLNGALDFCLATKCWCCLCLQFDLLFLPKNFLGDTQMVFLVDSEDVNSTLFRGT